MFNPKVDAVLGFLTILCVILFAFEIVLHYILWRIRTIYRNMVRREKEKEKRSNKQQHIREERFWSQAGQEELYRDFGNAGPTGRESSSRQLAGNPHSHRSDWARDHRVPHGPSKFQGG